MNENNIFTERKGYNDSKIKQLLKNQVKKRSVLEILMRKRTFKRGNVDKQVEETPQNDLPHQSSVVSKPKKLSSYNRTSKVDRIMSQNESQLNKLSENKPRQSLDKDSFEMISYAEDSEEEREEIRVKDAAENNLVYKLSPDDVLKLH